MPPKPPPQIRGSNTNTRDRFPANSSKNPATTTTSSGGGKAPKRSNTSAWRPQNRPDLLDPVVRSISDPGQTRLDRFQKPAAALDDYGFVSKGDNRLLNFQNQEEYHKRIVSKYLEFCASSGSVDALQTEFENLATSALSSSGRHAPLSPRPTSAHSSSPPPHHPSTALTKTLRGTSSTTTTTTSSTAPSTFISHFRRTPAPPPSPAASRNAVYANERNAELSAILLRMRKLREGLVASGRADAFAVDVYKSQIRAAILVQQVDSYYPALQHLLSALSPLLSSLDTLEFATYQLVHLACCAEDYAGAFATRRQYGITDTRALQVLDAVMHANYWSFRAARNRVDQYLGRLVDFAEPRMRETALACVQAAYFTVTVPWLETLLAKPWGAVQDEFELAKKWEVDVATGTVTVRRPRTRAREAGTPQKEEAGTPQKEEAGTPQKEEAGTLQNEEAEEAPAAKEARTDDEKEIEPGDGHGNGNGNGNGRPDSSGTVICASPPSASAPTTVEPSKARAGKPFVAWED